MDLKDKIRDSFERIYADEVLREHTKQAVFQKMRKSRKKRIRLRRMVPAVACVLFLLLGVLGYQSYFTPTSVIGIDVNPSIELNINRFSKVVSVKAWNDGGQELADSLDVRFLDYTEAVEQILNSVEMKFYRENNVLLTIAVMGSDAEQSNRMMADIQNCTAGRNNTYCFAVSEEEMEAAHEVGLSCGKYRAYLRLKELKEDVTAEEIREMPMRELRKWIEQLEANNGTEQGNSIRQGRESNHGQGNSYGHREGNG